MNSEIIMEFRHVSKHFENSEGHLGVLEDISLSIHKGEIVALVGPSGCGKTTVLNIASELIPVDQGEVVFSSKNRLAYTFQEPRLLPWKTVDENLAFVQQNFLSTSEGAEVRERILAEAKLLASKDAYPSQLSGGMKQRAEIARALSVKPDLLLMDEPFKSLDIALKYQLRELLLQEHANQQFSVILVTHDPEEAVLLSDRVVILSDKPARIRKEIVLDLPREKRSLRNEILYKNFEKILSFVINTSAI